MKKGWSVKLWGIWISTSHVTTQPIFIRPDFLISWFTGICVSDYGGGGGGGGLGVWDETKIKSSENDPLTGHFQSFFLILFF